MFVFEKPALKHSQGFAGTQPFIRDDYERLTGKAPSAIRLTLRFLLDPGFRAVVLYRAGRTAFLLNRRFRTKLYQQLLFHLSHTTISPHARIGPGLTIRHVGGIVIGGRAVIGKNCDLRQGVTIGGNSGREVAGRTQPTIGDDVVIGAGAKILGPVAIGNSATIGANAVVLSNVPDNAVVVGVPAVIVRVDHRAIPVTERNGSIEQTLSQALSRISELESRVNELESSVKNASRANGPAR